MKAAIIVFPGTNRERDMRLALKRASGREPAMLFHREAALPAGIRSGVNRIFGITV
jgi:phosphoribosylformylglycinamidine synthase